MLSFYTTIPAFQLEYLLKFKDANLGDNKKRQQDILQALDSCYESLKTADREDRASIARLTATYNKLYAEMEGVNNSIARETNETGLIKAILETPEHAARLEESRNSTFYAEWIQRRANRLLSGPAIGI